MKYEENLIPKGNGNFFFIIIMQKNRNVEEGKPIIKHMEIYCVRDVERSYHVRTNKDLSIHGGVYIYIYIYLNWCAMTMHTHKNK